MHRTAPALPVVLVLAGALCAPAPVDGQTDFYNLDKDRPLRVEDAYATKRHAFEFQASPFTLSQDRAGVLRFQPSMELKHGLLPGLEASVGMGMDRIRDGSDTSTSLGEVELSALLNLWVEGPDLPAAAIRVTGHLPTGSDHAATLEVRGILTRSLVGPVRGHLNGAAIGGGGRDESWWAGAALDYVLPFHHTLLLLEWWLASPPDEGRRRLHSSAGLRFQLSPTLALDGGMGRSWTGDVRQDWTLTLGVTHEFGVRALFPGLDR
jgi:hypothetical protein